MKRRLLIAFIAVVYMAYVASATWKVYTVINPPALPAPPVYHIPCTHLGHGKVKLYNAHGVLRHVYKVDSVSGCGNHFLIVVSETDPDRKVAGKTLTVNGGNFMFYPQQPYAEGMK